MISPYAPVVSMDTGLQMAHEAAEASGGREVGVVTGTRGLLENGGELKKNVALVDARPGGAPNHFRKISFHLSPSSCPVLSLCLHPPPPCMLSVPLRPERDKPPRSDFIIRYMLFLFGTLERLLSLSVSICAPSAHCSLEINLNGSHYFHSDNVINRSPINFRSGMYMGSFFFVYQTSRTCKKLKLIIKYT